jgi:hypothetical protein
LVTERMKTDLTDLNKKVEVSNTHHSGLLSNLETKVDAANANSANQFTAIMDCLARLEQQKRTTEGATGSTPPAKKQTKT